jgi:hypothetical protein
MQMLAIAWPISSALITREFNNIYISSVEYSNPSALTKLNFQKEFLFPDINNLETILVLFVLASRFVKMGVQERKSKWNKSASIRDFIVLLVIIANHFGFGSSQNEGTFTGKFRISKANLAMNTPFQQLGIYNNGDTVNLADFASYTGPLALTVSATCCLARVHFTFQGVTTTDDLNPFFLGGNHGGNHTPVSDLRIPGIKTIIVEGFNTSNVVFQKLNLTFTIVGSIAAPVPVPVPVPVSVPVTPPLQVPVSVPIPVAAPVQVPMSVPIPAPGGCTIPKASMPFP